MTALDLPRVGEIRLDGMVLGFAVLLSLVTGVLFGLVPSLGASRPDLVGVLRASGQAASPADSQRVMLWLSMRNLLVVGQVALALVLLIGATLMMKSLAYLYRVDPGFKPANLLTMQISLAASRYDTDQKRAVFFEDLVRHVESLPGIRSAAVTLTLPMMGFALTPVQLADQPPANLNERPLGIIQNITSAYFRTLAIPLRRGREFSARDILGAAPVTMINESLARLFWPAYPNGLDPVGQHLLIGANSRPVEVVGIVADMRQGLDAEPRPSLFRPCAQDPPQSAILAVRTKGDPLRFLNAVRGQVLAIDRDQPISAVKTMDDMLEEEVGQRRLIMTLLGLFASTALLLTVVGIYGVIAYSVAQRTKEVGIRLALGAQEGDILRLVLGQGIGLAVSGVALGILGAFALTRVIQSLLFHVSATDPVTFVGIALLFVVVALAASYIPARRATRIDPLVALRYE